MKQKSKKSKFSGKIWLTAGLILLSVLGLTSPALAQVQGGSSPEPDCVERGRDLPEWVPGFIDTIWDRTADTINCGLEVLKRFGLVLGQILPTHFALDLYFRLV